MRSSGPSWAGRTRRAPTSVSPGGAGLRRTFARAARRAPMQPRGGGSGGSRQLVRAAGRILLGGRKRRGRVGGLEGLRHCARQSAALRHASCCVHLCAQARRPSGASRRATCWTSSRTWTRVRRLTKRLTPQAVGLTGLWGMLPQFCTSICVMSTDGYVTDHHPGGRCSLLSVCRSPLCSTILKRANLRSSRGTGCQKLTLLTSLPHRAHCQRLGTAGWREAQLFPVSGNGLCGEGTVWSVCLWRPVPLLGRAGGGRGMSKTREKRFGILPDVRFTTMSDIRTAVVSLYVAGGRGPVAGPGGAPSAPTSAWRAGAAGRLGALGPAGVWVVELL